MIIQLNPEIKMKKKMTRPIYKSRKMRKGLRLKINIKNNRNLITIINCYAPHSGITKKDETETEKLYEELERTTKKFRNKSSLLYIVGDMNATVGKKNDQQCIGKNSKGESNENGRHLLIDYCENNNLIMTNTCFSHKQAHLTTWQQTRIDEKTGKVTHVRKVLDYIMIERQYKPALTNSRTHKATLTISDHKLLITTLQTNWHILHRHKNRATNNKTEKIDTQKLIHDKQIQIQYKQSIQEKVESSEDRSWNQLKEIITNTAESIIGDVKPDKRKRKTNSVEIASLSKAQKDIKIQIDN